MSKTATMVRRAAATATLVFVPFAMMSAYPAGSMSARAFTANKLAAAIAASNGEAARPIFAKSEGMKLDSTAPSVTQAGYRSPGVRHKARVGDRDVSKTLTTAGARMLGDYGGFVLLEVDDAIADSIAQQSSIELADEYNRVLLNAGALDTSTPAVQALRSAHAGASGGKQMHLIQFVGPIRPEWYQALVATGVRIVTYMPSNAYLVYGDAVAISAVRRLAADSSRVQWDAAYIPAWRIDPAIAAAANTKDTPARVATRDNNISALGNEQFTIQLVEDAAENQATLALIDRFKLEPVISQHGMLGYVNVKVALPRDVVTGQIAARDDVVSIQQWITPRKMDERQDVLVSGHLTGSGPTPMNYLSYLAGKGFNTGVTAGFIVNLSDSGVDNATTTPNHFGLYRNGTAAPADTRIAYNRLVGTPNGGSTLQGCDGHGNENAHIIGGYVPTGTVGGVNFGAVPHADASGFRWGLGVAPFVKIGSSVIFDPGSFTSPNYADLESHAYNDGARISSNSWGSAANTYTTDSQSYDALVRDAQPAGSTFPAAGNQEMIIVFAAGNNGSGANTVGSPSTAKNVITVGAAEGVNPFGGADACAIDDTGADSANDLIFFSGRGPTADGRKKPDISAPGTHITGGVAQASIVSPAGSGSGAQLACFDGSGVCGGVGSNFFPAGQQWYTASSGTSHSTPAISGVAALIRQHFINQALTPPTPAMTKAMLLNTARYMNGVGANDTLPSNNQGMGEVDLENYFDVFATPHVLHDESLADTFTASGQQRVYTGTVGTSSKPYRVTLAWTDTPGPTSGSAYVNDLDLEVTIGGNTYKGNVFSGAFSATGGSADTRNNVESVEIPAGVSGSFIIKVKASNIAGDGVPGNANPLDQDFALVLYNGSESPLPVITAGATAITAESCSAANNAIDPNETVTLNFALGNVGTANTSNLTAVLQASGGVTAPSGPQNYGALVANGAAVSRAFTFTAGTTCGQPLVATFHLQDGASDLGNVAFNFLTGALSAPVSATYSSGNIATPIPDVASVEVPITIADSGIVSDVNVKVRANHTFDGDLVFEVVAPDGTTVSLAANRGSGGDNYGSGANDCSGTPTVFDDSAATAISAGTPPFAGSFKPESPLAALAGKAVNGIWKLRATDTAAQDTGTLGCVQLEIARQNFACCGVAGTPAIVSGGPTVLTAESFAPPNGVPDPGETVTVNVPLLNSGTGNTANLVATLQNAGGVVPVTTSQNYGVVVAGGSAVSKAFTFQATGVCGGSVNGTIHLQDGAIDLGNVTFTFQLGTTSTTTTTYSSPGLITIPASGTGATTGAPAAPYPATIAVAGAPSSISALTTTVAGLAHTFPDDIDILLVSPSGRAMIVMSDAGQGDDVTGVDITLDDGAATAIPDAATLVTGTYRPGNYGTVQDPFPAPAPAGPYLTPAPGGADTLSSAFTGVPGGDPNGLWSLYVVDDAATDVGSLSGWSLALASSTPVCAPSDEIFGNGFDPVPL